MELEIGDGEAVPAEALSLTPAKQRGRPRKTA
jgi:hypothetical protein